MKLFNDFNATLTFNAINLKIVNKFGYLVCFYYICLRKNNI